MTMHQPPRESTPRVRPDRAVLARHLDAVGITGRVATPRENNLSHIGRFLAQERQFDFGVALLREWTHDEVFDLMVDRVGISDDRRFVEGVDTISADKCIDALDRMRSVLLEVVEARGVVLFATGHPAGLLPVHQAVAAWAESRGATIAGLPVEEQSEPLWVSAPVGGDVRRIDRVHVWHQHGGLPHTHFAEPMLALREALQSAGERTPDLVVADHGWAGAAGTTGLRTVGYADCNDPALFVAEAQGQVDAAVPLDDNVLPQFYELLIDYLIGE
ncbi:phosphatase [Brevibacterium jeotgali]|uniref:Phosphatase n=1 Tax=Brevibacterium jeotgali TaxID=1262550 RepID=A0A2H1L1V4_9MICO|nr:histidinol phosphate phosphatase hisN-like protein [Brevibacterium jeotgali]SMY10896.1 Phosphatase [Brevibacterium jeotgali]